MICARPAPGRISRGHIVAFGQVFPCALGRAGVKALKHEGDGATPLGRWPLRRVLYRRDRVSRPLSRLRVRALRPGDGWCDLPTHGSYNRLVRLPHPVSAEALWRPDHLYDIIVVLGYNDRPRVAGRGSAIFIHLARPGFGPTAGCIALEARALRRILAGARPGTHITITR